jgi:hypothetical protein
MKVQHKLTTSKIELAWCAAVPAAPAAVAAAGVESPARAVSAPPAAADETVAVGTAAPTNYESFRWKKKKQFIIQTIKFLFLN